MNSHEIPGPVLITFSSGFQVAPAQHAKNQKRRGREIILCQSAPWGGPKIEATPPMVFVNGKIPSFDSWMMAGGTPYDETETSIW